MVTFRTIMFWTMLVIALAGLGCQGQEPAPRPPAAAALDPRVATLIRETADAADASPGDPNLRTRLGMVYEANALDALAELTYNQVLDRHPRAARVWFHLAACRRRRGDLDGAIAAITESVRHQAGYAPAQARLAMWLLDAGRLDDAAEAIDRARGLATSVPPQQTAGGELAFAAVRLHLQRREPGPAIELTLTRGLIAGANAAYGRHLLAIARRMTGDVTGGDLAGSAPAKPSFPDPWTGQLAAFRTGFNHQRNRAVALFRRGDFAAALELLEGLRQRDPRDQRLLGMLAQCHLSLGAVGEALAVSTAAVEAAPEHFGAQVNLAKVMLIAARRRPEEVPGNNRQAVGLESALAHAERAAALRPGSGVAQVTRASILFALDRPEPAVAATRHAWQLDARDPAPMLRAGALLLEAGDWRQAGEVFEAVLAAYPEESSALLGRERAEKELGELAGGHSDG